MIIFNTGMGGLLIKLLPLNFISFFGFILISIIGNSAIYKLTKKEEDGK